jgi:hypothetical protein
MAHGRDSVSVTRTSRGEDHIPPSDKLVRDSAVPSLLGLSAEH